MFHVKHLDTEKVREVFRGHGFSITEAQAQSFAVYHAQLLRWNERAGLVSSRDVGRVLSRHFLESAALLRFPVFQGPRAVLDLGTGAGFPGLPLKIVNPALRLALLESKRWKILFLRDLVPRLELTDVTILAGRAEALSRQPHLRAAFEVVVTRAVGDLTLLWRLAQPFLQPSGVLVAVKGARAEEEVAALRHVVPTIDAEVCPFPLPLPQADRQRVVFVRHAA